MLLNRTRLNWRGNIELLKPQFFNFLKTLKVLFSRGGLLYLKTCIGWIFGTVLPAIGVKANRNNFPLRQEFHLEKGKGKNEHTPFFQQGFTSKREASTDNQRLDLWERFWRSWVKSECQSISSERGQFRLWIKASNNSKKECFVIKWSWNKEKPGIPGLTGIAGPRSS